MVDGRGEDSAYKWIVKTKMFVKQNFIPDGDGDNGDEETNGYDDCDVFSFVKSEVCDTSTTSSSTESDSDTENSSIDHFSTETRLVGTPIIISELPRSIIAQDLIYFSGYFLKYPNE